MAAIQVSRRCSLNSAVNAVFVKSQWRHHAAAPMAASQRCLFGPNRGRDRRDFGLGFAGRTPARASANPRRSRPQSFSSHPTMRLGCPGERLNASGGVH
jgi:hypothetical protein